MSVFMINGGRRLYGKYKVQGAKNSVLPLLAATFLCNGQSVLHNCPNLSDVKASIDILSCLGCEVYWEGTTVTVRPSDSEHTQIPECLMHKMRSSIVFMGAVAAKTGRAEMSLPGGCELGPRPIDLHIDALKKLGATVQYDGAKIICGLPNGALGTEIFLKFPSVGATENIILASVTGNGTTVIKNAACEPEITDLANFLIKAGADIKGAGTDTVIINGVKQLIGVEYTVMPDRIVAATCMCGVAMCGGKVELQNAVYDHLLPISSVLRDCGCEIEQNDNGCIKISSHKRLSNFDTITTQPYPGFPTDAGPLLVAMSCVSHGTGVFVENIFENRLGYVDELNRLGANVKTFGRVAVITGVKHLHGNCISAADLRGGAALALAAMASSGTSRLNNIEFIDRGYDDFEHIFNQLGADIKRC